MGIGDVSFAVLVRVADARVVPGLIVKLVALDHVLSPMEEDCSY